MSEKVIIERINKDLSVLIDRFMANTRADLGRMREALDAQDVEELRRMGHTIKGTGYGYGFKGMGELGKLLEEDARTGDFARIGSRIDDFADYLDHVVVEFD